MPRPFPFFALLPLLACAQQPGPIRAYLYPGLRTQVVLPFQTEDTPPATLVLTAKANGLQYTLSLIREQFPPIASARRPYPQNFYLVPRDVPFGRATIQIPGQPDSKSELEVESEPFDMLYTLSGPSFVESFQAEVAYAQQQTGSGPIRQNLLTDPARPGDRITLWATGMRDVTVYIPWTEIADARVTHQTDGLERIEFTLPESTPAHCYLPVFVNDRQMTISTASASERTCAHPMQLTAEDLLRLDRGSTVAATIVKLRPDGVGIHFGDFSAQEFGSLGETWSQLSPAFGCSVKPIQALGRGRSVSPGVSFPTSNLQRTALLVIPDGGQFSSQENPFSSFGFYDPEFKEPERFWQSGDWTFRIDNEDFLFQVQTLFRWKSVPGPFSRNGDFTVEWDPKGGSQGDYVSFYASLGTSQPVNGTWGNYILCAQPVSAGKLIVPAALLRAIPPTDFDREPFLLIDAHLQSKTYLTRDKRYVSIRFQYVDAIRRF